VGKPAGTPIRKAGGYLRLWKMLEHGGLHTLEAVAEISRDDIAQRCAPMASVYHLDELGKLLHRHGLDYATGKPQAPRGSAGGMAAWEKLLKALRRFQGSPPWTGDDPWSFPGGEEVQACYAAGICAAAGERNVSAAWRTLWKATEGARYEQRQRFVAAFGAVAVAA
jgi:hypothetical protein